MSVTVTETTPSSALFCLFCYKSSEKCSIVNDSGVSENIKRFTKVLNRFTQEDYNSRIVQNGLLNRLSDNDKLLKYCSRCSVIITDLCEIYDQIKILELQLDLKLDKLTRKINYANLVPSRWVQITEALNGFFPDDFEKKAAGQHCIREFRQNILKSAQRRKRNSQPRVSLQKILTTSDNQPELIEKWPCHECPKIFPSYLSLRFHLKSHTGRRDYKCQFCGKTFLYAYRLKKHLRNYHGYKKWNEKITKRSLQTGNIRKPISEENDFNNLVELTTFPEDDTVKVEPTSVAEEFQDQEIHTVCCKFCKKPFAGVTQLTKHITDELCPARTAPKICKICGNKFKDIFRYKMHLKLHDRPNDWEWNCKICWKGFHFETHLKAHMETRHPKDLGKPGQQNKTENSTIESEAITVKVEPVGILPSNDMVVDDEYLWENASTVSSAVQHIETTNSAGNQTTSLDKPGSLECEICLKKFKVAGHKVYHFRVCHDLKGNPEMETFKCKKENCTAYFLKKTQLLAHYKVEHDGVEKVTRSADAKFWCKRCKTSYGNHREFLDHIRLYMYKSCRTYGCQFCGERFNSMLILNEHRKERHGNEMEGEMDSVEAGEDVNQEEDEMVYEETNVFEKTGEGLDGGEGALAELEDLD